MGCRMPTICDGNQCKGGEGGDRKGGEVPTGVKRPKAGNGTAIDMKTERPEGCTEIVADRRKGVHETVRKRCGVECGGILPRHMCLRIRGNRSGGSGDEERKEREKGKGKREKGRGKRVVGHLGFLILSDEGLSTFFPHPPCHQQEQKREAHGCWLGETSKRATAKS